MKITEAFNQGRPALSFEFFPPRDQEQENALYQVISRLRSFRPDYVSVTYGALGTTQAKTFFWAARIKNEFGIEPVAHLTCVAADKRKIKEQLKALAALKVNNILALRGDPPADQPDFVPPNDGFAHADELIAFIKSVDPGFCLGAAGYPEKHPEAVSLSADIDNLKKKVRAGAEFIVSQLFFDNCFFFDFVKLCRQAGIDLPIIPGIMPISSWKQINKMAEMCGASLPETLLKTLKENENNPPAIEAIGREQAVRQCQELLRAGVPGLHFFVLNRAEPISSILKELKLPGH